MNTSNFLTFANSNYTILENIKSGVGEWNSVLGTFTNDLIVGDTFNDENRGQISLFPFVVIGDGAGGAYDVVRVGAVHAVQPAHLQDVSGAGQRHQVREASTR